MQAAIGCSRVSTREQGRSGLGLAAPRHDIETFALHEGFRCTKGSQSGPGTRMCRPLQPLERRASLGHVLLELPIFLSPIRLQVACNKDTVPYWPRVTRVSSTRRFCALPAGVSLEATGSASP